jgi:hypothetical protein
MKVLDTMPATDSIGVVAFDAMPTVVAPFAASRDRASIADRLRGVEPGGSTAIAPAVGVALDWLKGVTAARRHILLVSDGRTTPADAERLLAAVRGRGIELSVIAIGPDADRDLLGRLARSTGGRAYFPDNIRQLPMLAARDASESSGGVRLEGRVTMTATAHPALAGIDRARLPELRGYVVSARKAGSEPLLVSHLDDPLLAVWRYGLGRAGVFTSDLESPWGASMLRWPGFRQLWTQTAQWATRRTDNRLWRPALLDRKDGTYLIVDAEHADGRFANQLELRATIRTPTERRPNVPLRAVAPGRYEAAIGMESTGAYSVTIDGRDRETGVEDRAQRTFYWSAERERAARPDLAALARLAQMTGGDLLAGAANPFDHERAAERRDISSWLGAAGLVLFLLDVGRRRRAGAALARWWHGRRDAGAATHPAAA